MIKNIYLSSCKVPIVLVSLIKLEFSQQILEKGISLREAYWSLVIPSRQT
jgi:hypothetical protein